MSNNTAEELLTETKEHTNSETIQSSSLNSKDYRKKSIIFDFELTNYHKSTLISGFVAVNFLLFTLITKLEAFANINTSLLNIFGNIFGVLGIATALTTIYYIKDDLQLAIKHYHFNSIFVSALIVLSSIILTITWYLSNPEEFTQSLLAEYIIINTFFINSYLLFLDKLLNKLYLAMNIDLRNYQSNLKVVGDSGNNVPNNDIEIKAGNIVDYKIGDIVTNDSLIMHGGALILERQFSGKTRLLQKTTGQTVWAGSVIKMGNLTCRIECSTEESRLYDNMPKFTKFDVYSNYQTLIIILSFLLGIFCMYFWKSRGLGFEYTEVGLIGFMTLSLLGEWLWIRKTKHILQRNKLFFDGILFKNNEAVSKITTIKNILLFKLGHEYSSKLSVKQINVLDDRVESSKLYSLLMALASPTYDDLTDRNQYAVAIVDYFNNHKGDLSTVTVLDSISDYGDVGAIANIGEVEITWGPENFILQRGIQLSPNFNKKQEFDSLYLAIDDAVVAKVDFERQAIISNKDFLHVNSKLGVYFNYLGMGEQKELDEIGSAFGLELAMIKNCENTQALNDKLNSMRNSALLSANKEILTKYSDKLTTISYFDRLNFELNDTDIKFVDNNWKEFLHSLLWLKQFNQMYVNIDYIYLAVGIGLAGLIFTGFMETEIILMLCATLICSSMYFITKNLRSW